MGLKDKYKFVTIIWTQVQSKWHHAEGGFNIVAIIVKEILWALNEGEGEYGWKYAKYSILLQDLTNRLF